MNFIAIGDIHGEKWKLRNLLSKLPRTTSDRLVFLGDYVDRGPDVAGTLDLLLEIRADHPDTVFLRGNHDQAMLDARDYFDPDRTSAKSLAGVQEWFAWGGAETILSYPGTGPWFHRVPEAHWAFLLATEFEFTAEPFRFVHAGFIPPGQFWNPPLGWSADPRLMIREPFLSSTADFGGRVIFGHTVQRRGPLIQPNKIGIDTGAVYGGRLTAAVLDPEHPDRVEFVQSD